MKITLLPRVAVRLIRLGWVIVSGVAALAWFLRSDRRDPVKARIAWMQWMSRRFLSLLHCEVTVSGSVPTTGLVACNHLGYVDILVIGSVCPAIFVAKSDVMKWPVFGWLAGRAGTVFVSRNEPAKVAAQLLEMERPMSKGHPVVLFPEGTSSDGTSVLPFRSSLLESAVKNAIPVTPSAITYDLCGQGDVRREIAYWGDLVLAPHLLNLLSKKSFKARLSFGAMRPTTSDRKTESKLLHHQVSELHRTRP